MLPNRFFFFGSSWYRTQGLGGLLCRQMPAPDLLGRHRPNKQQISSTWYFHSYPWEKPAQPPGKTDPHPTKKKLKQETRNRKGPAAEGVGCSECTGESEKSKELLST
jgi:hypothetical protein